MTQPPSDKSLASLHNAGAPLDQAWLAEVPGDPAEVASDLAALAAVAPDPSERPADLLRAVRCIDLTTLADDDTDERIRGLCLRARQPVPAAILAALGAPADLHVAAVCVHAAFVPIALAELAGSGVGVCTVSAGFPTGAGSLEERVAEVLAASEGGAHEIDVVIRRELANAGAWEELYEELRGFRAAAGPALLKVILGTGELNDLTTIGRASLVAMMAGADFIKTSTGKEAVNATLPAGMAMARAIRAYTARTHEEVGLKPAGGISTADQALAWIDLVRSELGPAYVTPGRFRFGASSLLSTLVAELERLT